MLERGDLLFSSLYTVHTPEFFNTVFFTFVIYEKIEEEEKILTNLSFPIGLSSRGVINRPGVAGAVL